MFLAGCEDVDASATWKESDIGESAACVGMNRGGVDIVERPKRDMDAFVSVDARCNIGAGFLEGASWDDPEVDESRGSRNEVPNVTAGSFDSTPGVVLGEGSSSAACSSLAGGDGGGGPILFEAMSDWLNRAGCGRSCLEAVPDTRGVGRSDRPTLWRSESGEVAESSFTASSVMVNRWTSWD